METGRIRTLDEGERRRMAARAMASAAGGPALDRVVRAPSRPGRDAGGRALSRDRAARRRALRAPPARPLIPLLLEWPAKLGFPTAFCAAATAWGAALVLALGCFGVVGR